MPNIDACLHADHMAELPVQRSNQTQAVLHDIEDGVQAEWQRLKRSPVWLPNPLPLELFSNVLGGKSERGFWSIRQCTGYHGFYEKQVLGDWAERAISCPEYVASRFKTEFRMSESSLKSLVETYGSYLEKETTNMRETICVEKRFMIARLRPPPTLPDSAPLHQC